nr:cell wall-binding repeat-containing protein [Agromyces luteolus]
MGRVPAGRYTVEFADAGNPPTLRDAFLGGAAAIDSATVFDVTAGAVTGNIDGGPIPLERTVQRLAGPDRFATSAAIARRFAPGVPVVYLANGLNWPDALSAGPAAAHQDGVLLLTRQDVLPSVIAAELERLAPERIVVVGGPAAVSDAVYAQVAEAAPTVTRVWGADRYATSRAIIRDAFGERIPSRSIVISTGRAFPDALSGGALAALWDSPLLLIDGRASELNPETRSFLWGTNFLGMAIIGGEAAVTTWLQDQLEHFTNYSSSERIGGADRYDTNRRVVERFPAWAPEAGAAIVANGTGFADALGGVALSGSTRAPLVLTPSRCIPRASLEAALAARAMDWQLLGGTASLDARVEALTAC